MNPTPEQAAAIAGEEPNRVIIACPGTGKTFTLVRIIADLIEARGRSPECIAAVTFTRQAARELRERVSAHVVGKADRITFGTSTALALEIVRRYHHVAGLRHMPTVYDENDCRDVMKATGERLGIRSVSTSRALSVANGATGVESDAETDRLVAAYFRALTDANAVPLDHLISRASFVLQESEEAAREWSFRCRYLVVDEFQDTAADEVELYDALEPRSRVLVGDPNQELYRFRGTDRRYLMDAAGAEGAGVYNLTRSFRSLEGVTGPANRLISRNPEHGAPIIPAGDGGRTWIAGPQEVVNLDSDIVYAVREELQEGLSVAVLGRTNRVVDEAAQALERAGVPVYRLASPRLFHRLPEVRALFGALRAALNPRDEIAIGCIAREWDRIPTPRSDPWFDAVQRSNALDTPLLHELGWKVPEGEGLRALAGMFAADLVRIYRETGRTTRAENVHRALGDVEDFATAHGDDIEAFVDWLTMREIRDAVGAEPPEGSVHLGTIHAAKGLEWDSVVVVGFEEGCLPSERGEIEEERRIGYVAITRAREAIGFVWCRERGKVSSFVREMR